MNFRAQLSLTSLETRENPSGPTPIDPISTDPPPTTTTTTVIIQAATTTTSGTTS
jgi:hypothetical protein